MDKQQITEVTGFGTAPTGGFFQCAPGQTPAAMRTAGDFAVAMLIRFPSDVQLDSRFAAGVAGAGTGWGLFYDTTTASLLALLGPTSLTCEPALCGEDHALVVFGLQAGNGLLLVNGEVVDASPVVYAPELVQEFSIGGRALQPTEAFRNGGVVAVGFTDVLPTPQQTLDLWAETEAAGDLIDQQGLFQYLWSARDGMANVVDGGNESWVDIRSAVAVNRVGAQLGMSAGARDAEWTRLSVFL